MPGKPVSGPRAPSRAKPFASRGQIVSWRSLAWPLAGAELGAGAEPAASAEPAAGIGALLLTAGSLAAALINCGAVGLGAGGGVSAPVCRTRLRLTT